MRHEIDILNANRITLENERDEWMAVQQHNQKQIKEHGTHSLSKIYQPTSDIMKKVMEDRLYPIKQ